MSSQPPKGPTRGRSRGITPAPRIQPVPQQRPAQQPPTQQQPQPPPSSSTQPPARFPQGRGGTFDPQPTPGAHLTGPSARGSLAVNQPSDCILFTRPKTLTSKLGTAGKRVDLETNYVEVTKKPDWCLCAYRVDFVPEEDSTVIRKALLRQHKDNFGAYLFDGSTLFTTKVFTDPVEYHGKRKNDEPYTIKIKRTHVLDSTNPQYMQVFNIILRRGLALLDLQLVGRDYYDMSSKVKVTQFNFEVWPGISTSIRQHERDVLLNIDIAHKIMRQDTVFDVISACPKRGPEREQYLKNALVGITVITLYNNQTYRIDDVDFTSTPLSTFKKKDQDVTFMQYYKDRYNMTIHNANQPLLLSRPKARDIRGGRNNLILLIPELCNLTGLTDDMRNNFQLMKSLAEHTRIRPADRMEKSKALLNRISKCIGAQEELSQWGLTLAPNLVRFQGRVLPNEDITLGDKRTIKTDQSADWTRGLRNQSLYRIAPLTNWAIIYPRKFASDVQTFIRTLISASKGIKYPTGEPNFVEELADDRHSGYISALDKILPKAPDLVLCIVPNNRGDRYAAIKVHCCVDRPIPSQVLLTKNLTSKGAMSIATKLAIQMNCKMGGAPWAVAIPFSVPVMICGFDVCHDTKNKEQSFGALVATIDKTYTHYYSSVISHKNGEELSNFLAIQLCQAVSVFKKNNGVFPSKIIVYRDGVGDGNVSYVFSHEIEVIKKKLKEMTNADPVLTFIIVSKRISTRFFYNRGNPMPGTVVDDTVTSPEKYDFFIVPQAVNQGTVSPTSFNVIYDNSGLNPDVMQRLTYKLCHMYFNWSGTVRVPAPCQYAHKLAFLVGQHIHGQPSTSLDELLYFL